MNCYIIDKKKINESDLWLKTIDEQNFFRQFKIPGILKSNKRSAYLLIQGTIWNFTFAHQNAKLPKEFSLISSPFSETIEYEDLEFFSNLCKPLLSFLPRESLSIYHLLEQISHCYQDFSELEKRVHSCLFHLNVVQQCGIFHIDDHCQICCGNIHSPNDPNDKTAIFYKNFGTVCEACSKKVELINREGFFLKPVLALVKNPTVVEIGDLEYLEKNLGRLFVHT